MANEEHLALLKQGVDAWNYWRISNHQIIVDLSRADLSGLELIGVDLKGVNLKMASLNEANLSRAELSKANLSGANLRMANFSKVKLSSADLRGAYLSLANLSKATLRMANLSEANLKMANLSEATLSMANFSGTNLSGANLEKTIVFDTNFNKAIFTGSCLEDWQTNSDTNFEAAICDYVYLRHNQQERRPQKGNFAPGEFTKLFQKSLNIADLSFSAPVNLVAVTKIEGDIPSYNLEQNLPEVAAEIQQILEQLEQAYPINSPLEKLLAVTGALRIIETNHSLKNRILDALNSSGTEVVQHLVHHRLSKILFAALEN